MDEPMEFSKSISNVSFGEEPDGKLCVVPNEDCVLRDDSAPFSPFSEPVDDFEVPKVSDEDDAPPEVPKVPEVLSSPCPVGDPLDVEFVKPTVDSDVFISFIPPSGSKRPRPDFGHSKESLK